MPAATPPSNPMDLINLWHNVSATAPCIADCDKSGGTANSMTSSPEVLCRLRTSAVQAAMAEAAKDL